MQVVGFEEKASETWLFAIDEVAWWLQPKYGVLW